MNTEGRVSGNYFGVQRPLRLPTRGRTVWVYFENCLGTQNDSIFVLEFNGNLSNDGLIDNLPQGACVEVPVVASRKGFEAIRVGSIPAPCALLTGLSAQIEMLAVEGCLKGDAELVYQAIAHDPLTAAKLSLAEARSMTKEMFRKNQKWLPHFKKIEL